MKAPRQLVSILVWSDNCADQLATTLDSLLAQTWDNTEIVVIDNHSRDGSREILADYGRRHPRRLREFPLPGPTTRSLAEHLAATQLKSEFVALASAGSRSIPTRIEASLEQLLATPNLGGVCSCIALEDEAGRPVTLPSRRGINEGDVILRRRLPREGDIIDPDTCTLRTRLLREHAPNPGLLAAGHLELWLHILDDSELLRSNDLWVRRLVLPSEAGAGPTLAEAYETVACIAAALRRWPLDQIFMFRSQPATPERQMEEAAAEAQLAIQLLELDRKFFGQPALGCHEAYLHALAAVGRAAHCQEAQDALRLTLQALGDESRCQSGASRPLADWQSAPRPAIPATTAGVEAQSAARFRRWQEKHALREIDGAYLGEHLVRLWRTRPAFIVLELGGGSTPLSQRLADQFYPPQAARTAQAGTSLDSQFAGAKAGDETWVILLPADGRPEPAALMHLADAINRLPQARAFYGDDVVVGSDPRIPQPRFKPDLDPLLLANLDYLGAIAVHLPTALALAGELQADAAAPAAIARRLLQHHPREAIGHIQEILFTLPGIGVAGTTPAMPMAPQPIDTPRPAVALLIVADAGVGASADAGEPLLQTTRYPNLEIFPCQPRPGESLGALINEFAVRSTAEFLAIASAGSRAESPDWLDQAVGLAEAGDYAAVGVAGLATDRTHYWGTGTVLGIGSGFDALHRHGVGPGDSGHLGRARFAHEVSAVAADGLVTRRQRFIEVGGLDPSWQLPDVMATDYCLRLRSRGHRIAWTPQAALLRDRATLPGAEPPVEQQLNLRDRFIGQWRDTLASDPYWNRHLSLLSADPEPEDDLVFRWNPDFRDRLRVLALPMPASGQAEYRVTAPLRALDNAGLAQTMLACEPLPSRERAPMPSELARLAPDTLYLQAAFDDVRFQGLRSCARFNPGIFRIFSLDDRVSDMPAYNASSKALPRDVVMRRMGEALRCCNRLVVSTAPLAEQYRGDIDNIVVVPNRLEKARWCGLEQKAGGGLRPRVGWAGALQHAGDLAMIREVVETLAGEVDWIFFGMIPAGCEPFIKEFHGTVHLDAYPAKLASLGLDLAVAPLEVNLFNEAKSNLRLLEYGIFGWPVICTDIDPYRTNHAPVCRVPNQAGRWIAAIREHLADRSALQASGKALQDWVTRHYLLEDHLDEWLRALKPG